MNFIIIAQITSVISWLLLVYSYYKDDIDQLLFIQIISTIFDCLSYLFLNATSGLIVSVLELFKGFGYYKTDKDTLIFILSLPVYLIMVILTYDTPFSLFPIIASIIDSFSLTKNKKIATIGCIISSLLWGLYDFKVLAYTAVVADVILIFSNISILILGYSRLLKSTKLRILQSKTLTKNLYITINNLDKKNYGVEYSWPYDYEKNIESKNKKSILIIKSNDKVVGYLNYLIINEQEYLKIINSNKIITNYNIDNVVSLQKNKKNYLVIDSINVENKYHNSVVIKLIVKKIKQLIINFYHNNYAIENIISVSLNQFEKDVLEAAGFNSFKQYDKNQCLYQMDKIKIKEYLKTEKKDYYNYRVYENKNISKELICEINRLDKKFYNDNYLWDSEYQLKLFNKNKNSLIIVTYKNKVVGYINYLVINKEKYIEMINSNITVDNFSLEDIKQFNKNKNNYLTFNSIVIDKTFQNGYTIKLLTRRLKRFLRQMNYNNYKISGINSFAVSKDGQKFLEGLGFEKQKKLEDGNYLYLLEDKNLKNFLN